MESLWQWFSSHATVVSSLATTVMVLVWIFYLHLFYNSQRVQRRPLIHIHQTQGDTPEAACLIVNLGKEPVHILGVIAAVQTDTGYVESKITTYDRISPEQSDKAVEDALKEGPLMPGGYLYLSAFQDVLKEALPTLDRRLVRRNGELDTRGFYGLAERVHCLEVRVVALHTHYRQPIGARRSFRVGVEEGQRLGFHPKMRLTEQMYTFRKRREASRWLDGQFRLEAAGGTRRERIERDAA